MKKSTQMECQKRLLHKRQEIMNTMTVHREDFHGQAASDESDFAQILQNQNTTISQREMQITLLHEIEHALARMENGEYGICEETDQTIEEGRLLAIPWTRTSREGAEIREREMKKRRVG